MSKKYKKIKILREDHNQIKKLSIDAALPPTIIIHHVLASYLESIERDARVDLEMLPNEELVGSDDEEMINFRDTSFTDQAMALVSLYKSRKAKGAL